MPRTNRRRDCVSCGQASMPWDVLAGQLWCPDCLEGLILGTCGPIRFLRSRLPCQVCRVEGTVPYRTSRLGSGQRASYMAINLCPRHFQDFVAMRLSPDSYFSLVASLKKVGIRPEGVFYLGFYDALGHSSSALGGSQEEDVFL